MVYVSLLLLWILNSCVYSSLYANINGLNFRPTVKYLKQLKLTNPLCFCDENKMIILKVMGHKLTLNVGAGEQCLKKLSIFPWGCLRLKRIALTSFSVMVEVLPGEKADNYSLPREIRIKSMYVKIVCTKWYSDGMQTLVSEFSNSVGVQWICSYKKLTWWDKYLPSIDFNKYFFSF